MAKSKHGAARRGDGKAVSPAKKTGAANKAAARPAGKAPAKAGARSPAKKAAAAPAVKRKSVASKKVARATTRTAKPATRAPAAKKAARTQAPKKASESRAAKKAAVSRKSASPRAVSVPAPAVSNADVAARESRQHPAPRKRVHQRPAGGVAARLSVAGGDEQTITREDGRYALPATVNIDLPAGYRPGPGEEYMNPKQLAYFRQKLKDWRDQLVEESRQTMENLREEVRDVGDDAERATRETENSLELRTRDRYRKLISKIEKALRKIEEGRYGFCEETDEEIGLERLEARPIATLSLDAQERREHLQKQMGE